MKSRLLRRRLEALSRFLTLTIIVLLADQRKLAADPPPASPPSPRAAGISGVRPPSLADEPSAFWAAVRRGDIDEVWRRSKANPLLVNARDGKTGDTPVVEAIDMGNVGMVRLLLDNGAVVDGRNPDALLRAAAIVASEYYGDGLGPRPRLEAMNGIFMISNGERQAAARSVLREYRALMTLPPKAEADRLNILRMVIAEGGDVRGLTHKEAVPPIFPAVSFSNYKAVALLLRNGADAGTALAGATPLHAAAFFGPIEVVKILLAQKSDVNAANSSGGQRALDYAAAVGDTGIVRALLEAGANPNLVDVHGLSALHRAVWNDEIVNLLLARGADPKRTNSDGMTALHFASQVGSRMVVEKLLALGCEINASDAERFTPLLCAAENGRGDILRLLVERGADPGVRNRKGRSAVYLASGANNPELLQWLLRRRSADADAEDFEWGTPLMNAASSGHVENVRLLISAVGRIKGISDLQKRTLLMLTAFGPRALVEAADKQGNVARPGTVEDYLKTAELMIAGGVSVTATDVDGRTALHYAAMGGNEPVISYLVGKGADLESKDTRFGQTPLFHAVTAGNAKSVKALISLGAKVNARDRDDNQPIHWAAKSGHVETLKILLAHGASPAATERHGGTPLHVAVIEGNTGAARLLLDQRASVSAPDRDQNTPLHLAAGKGFVELTRLLLAHGAPVNAPGFNGFTPLHVAAFARIQKANLRPGIVSDPGVGVAGYVEAGKQNHPEDPLAIIKLLLEKGANRQARDAFGATPLDVARKLGTAETVRFFELAGPSD